MPDHRRCGPGRTARSLVSILVLALVLCSSDAAAPAAPAAAAATGARVHSSTPALGTFRPNVDLVPAGTVLSSYGNSGTGAVGDCVEAAAATYEQLTTDRARPLPSRAWIDAYDELAENAGERPGPDAGTSPLALFGQWETTGIAGTKISSVEAIATGEAALRAALRGGPIFLTLVLPSASAVSLPWTTNDEGYVTTPWTSALETPGYGGSGPTTHAALLVGVGHAYAYVATWGAILAISWRLFEEMIDDAWEIIA